MISILKFSLLELHPLNSFLCKNLKFKYFINEIAMMSKRLKNFQAQRITKKKKKKKKKRKVI